jgi:hypothetical protein
MAELGSVHDSTSLGKKRIFAIVSQPIAAELKGKPIRRIVIFDNHPDSLRLVLESGLDSGNDDAAALWERRASIICGSILITIILAALLWAILVAGASKAKKHFVTAAAPPKADFPLVKPSRFEMASDVLKAMISQS